MSDDEDTRRRSLLVDADALAQLLIGPNPPALLDVRWPAGPGTPRARYLAGHLPGAVYADLDTDLSGPPGDGRRGRHPLPEPETFERAMQEAGVSTGRPVVVYDDVGGLAAGRAWWVLRWAGHDDVRLLDGGLGAWVARGLPLHDGDIEATPGDFTVRAGARAVLDADGAAELPRRGGVLLDARDAERYSGEDEPFDPVAGHVPGALSLPTVGNLDEEGHFADGDVLRRRFAAVGVGDDVEVGVYCGSGVTAAHELLALELAGFPPGALFVGSWSEWSADPSRPVASGPEPGGGVPGSVEDADGQDRG